MVNDRKTPDKFWITFGMLILISIGAISWFIFLFIKKPFLLNQEPQSYIIVGISVLIYLLYEVGSIVLMEKLEKIQKEERYRSMTVVATEDIIESNRLKKEACNNCKDALKDKLTPEQLQKFEDAFYSAAGKYLVSRKKENQ